MVPLLFVACSSRPICYPALIRTSSSLSHLVTTLGCIFMFIGLTASLGRYSVPTRPVALMLSSSSSLKLPSPHAGPLVQPRCDVAPVHYRGPMDAKDDIDHLLIKALPQPDHLLCVGCMFCLDTLDPSLRGDVDWHTRPLFFCISPSSRETPLPSNQFPELQLSRLPRNFPTGRRAAALCALYLYYQISFKLEPLLAVYTPNNLTP